MSHPFKLTVELKQHTPIIHFQHDQEGATLRATEVKAKLDRFLTNDFPIIAPKTAEVYSKEIESIRIAQKEKKPTGYKLKFFSNKENVKYYYFESFFSKNKHETFEVEQLLGKHFNKNISAVAPAAYFADREKRTGDNVDALSGIKLGVFYSDNIKCEIFSINSRLLQLLNISLAPFFMINNFGTRSSKGFGSFEVLNPIKDYTIAEVFKNFGQCAFTKKIPKSIEETLKIIDSTYKKLRSNVATNESEIRDFFEDNYNSTWSKKLVTEKVAKGKKEWTPEEEDFDIQFIRALLGLPELHDYPQLKPDKPKVKIKEKLDEIQRFPSPITFTIHGDKLILFARENPNEILGRAFEFFVGKSAEDEQKKPNGRYALLKTPDQFEIKEFLKSSPTLKNSWNNVK